MAEVPRALIDGLSGALGDLSARGRAVAESALSALAAEFAGPDGLVPPERVAGFREEAAALMEALCAELSDMSAALAAGFYDDAREASGLSGWSAPADPRREPSATERRVRSAAASVARTGLAAQFAKAMADRVDYEVRRAAGECIVSAGLSDPERPRFARVPSGAETCAFCNMLASRGFVYLTAKTAGAFDHYHPSCDCRVVPGWGYLPTGPSRGAAALTTVEGYDPDALYDRYVDDLRSGRLSLGAVARSTSHVQNWGSERFGGYKDFADFIAGAEGIEDLQYRCAVAEAEWPKSGLSDRYYGMLRGAVARRRAEIRRADG